MYRRDTDNCFVLMILVLRAPGTKRRGHLPDASATNPKLPLLSLPEHVRSIHSYEVPVYHVRNFFISPTNPYSASWLTGARPVYRHTKKTGRWSGTVTPLRPLDLTHLRVLCQGYAPYSSWWRRKYLTTHTIHHTAIDSFIHNQL